MDLKQLDNSNCFILYSDTFSTVIFYSYFKNYSSFDKTKSNFRQKADKIHVVDTSKVHVLSGMLLMLRQYPCSYLQVFHCFFYSCLFS